MKMSYSILSIIGILVVVVMFSGCGFRYFDPQYYEFKKLYEEEGGLYIFDEKLEVETYDKDILSNGYNLIRKNDEHDIERINDRIISFKQFGYYFIDSQGEKHIVSYKKGFYYTEHGLWLHGDEGRGFHWDTERKMGGTNSRKNTFILKDNKWVKIEN
ncbi:hypothetical protein CQA53_10125 [Helicobacter didelphidarum]|uniref:Lipoprotein n=1 Tax=Helicobacter didelphidarum TaxID=2040648 RepID=A0A3D8I8F3_9HELI|nr:hypothetical protein [Helicobacter didelphidarum]RDU61440.1 hypothetical protein CQA53_10125 [Helicobacter didelphidarum]